MSPPVSISSDGTVDSDDDLKRAIAMSMETAHRGSPKKAGGSAKDRIAERDKRHPLAASTSKNASETEDEGEDMRKALALSLRDSATAPALKHEQGDDAAKPERSREEDDSEPTRAGLLGLDRKAMEQERLARLKRARGQLDEKQMSVEGSATRRGKLARREDADAPEAKSIPVRLPQYAQRNVSTTRSTSHETKILPSAASSLQYPNGVLKRTWAFKHPRHNDIKFSEVLQPATLRIAVLSAYDYDVGWLAAQLPAALKQIWVMHAPDAGQQAQLRRDAAAPGSGFAANKLQLHFPHLWKGQGGWTGCMHSKLMLLFHTGHLRVAVPTANLNRFDWGETKANPRTGAMTQPAVMENMVFLVDVPRREDERVGPVDELSPFGRGVWEFVKAMGLDDSVCDGVRKFDWRGTGDVRFVGSVSGSHPPSALPTGLHAVRAAVRDLGLAQRAAPLDLTYATSSLGSLTGAFLSGLHDACAGRAPGQKEASKGGAKAGKSSASRSQVQFAPETHLCIHFPTHDTVVGSSGGAGCGGTTTLARNAFEKKSFPRASMRDYESVRRGLLSHCKILLVRGQRASGEEAGKARSIAWAYVGSANLSEAAWGTVLKTKDAGGIMCRNWEAGVLLPVVGHGAEHDSDDACGEKGAGEENGLPGFDVFGSTLDIPFRVPGTPYNGRQPWFFREGMGLE